MHLRTLVGGAEYLTDFESGPHRLLVAVRCRLGESRLSTIVLLDTAAERSGSDRCGFGYRSSRSGPGSPWQMKAPQ